MAPLRKTLLALAAASAFAVDTVPELKVDKYLGRWFQMYSDKFNADVIQRNGECLTADYSASDKPNTVLVHNAENVGSPDGKLKTIDGYATIPDPSEPGKLTVTLQGVPTAADYWVVALGPETYGPEKLYEYAIVSDRHQIALFVLARDPKEFEAKWDAQVQTELKQMGFSGLLKGPVKTVQEGCTYEGHDAKAVLYATANYAAAPTTVDKVDLNAYIGRWYQMYTDTFVTTTFERDAYCATADYALLPSGNGVSVHNVQNTGSPSGKLDSIDGEATVPDASQPGQLAVKFDSVPFPGQYWILKLGPIVKGEYQYSVVSDGHSATLFILARDPAVFKSKYEAEVLAFVNPLFTGYLHAPKETVQGSQCAYSTPPAVVAPARRLRAPKA